MRRRLRRPRIRRHFPASRLPSHLEHLRQWGMQVRGIVDFQPDDVPRCASGIDLDNQEMKLAIRPVAVQLARRAGQSKLPKGSVFASGALVDVNAAMIAGIDLVGPGFRTCRVRPGWPTLRLEDRAIARPQVKARP